MDLEDEGEGDGESVWTQSLDTIVSTFSNSKNEDNRSNTSTSLRPRVTNFVRCWKYDI